MFPVDRARSPVDRTSFVGVSRRCTTTAFLFAATLCGTLPAAEPADWHTDPDDAWREAFTANKPMFLVISSGRCPACDKLKADVLAQPAFREWVEGRFVPVVMMAEDFPHVPERMKVQGYPTTLVIAPHAGVLHGALGVFDPAEFQRKWSVAEATAANATR